MGNKKERSTREEVLEAESRNARDFKYVTSWFWSMLCTVYGFAGFDVLMVEAGYSPILQIGK